MTCVSRWALAVLCVLLNIASAAAQTAGRGSLEGTVADSSGARLPGVTVDVRSNAPSRTVASVVTDAEGAFRVAALVPGNYTVEFQLEGFAPVRHSVRIDAGATATAAATLSVGGLRETVQVSAAAVTLDISTATQTASFSNEVLTELPSASRNYTHVIVAEAGVNAPLPDRTGKGLNLATAPGTQAEDASQSLNPSVNGARPTNNGLRINGIDTTNMLNASGSLGASVALPLEALEEVEVQTALPSAASGRNGGGNISLVTRAGGDRFSGSGGYYFQHEKLNANEFFLNRAGVAKPEFRRNDTTATLGGPLRRGRTTFFAAGQRQAFKSGYASNANAATGLPTGLSDVRNATTIAAAANEWLRTGAQDDPRFAQNFMNALRAFPAEQQAGLIAKFFADPARLTLRELTPGDIHPVALNILNVKRDGQYLIPSPQTGQPVLAGNGTFGREFLQQQVIPTELEAMSGFLSVQHQLGSSNQTRFTLSRSIQDVSEAFGWADASPSPTLGQTPAWLGGLSNTHAFGSRVLHEANVGYYDLQNTRISKHRDIFNSTLGINNPLEHAIGGLAALMPTIDIVTQRNSGGIGNAWDFWDIQRVWSVTDRWSVVTDRHSLQAGVEYRQIGLEGEYMARTNGDLDYDNWVLFFTGHGAAGGGSDLDQGDTRRNYFTKDIGGFVQDDWRLGGGLTLNAGLRYDVFGTFSERNGRIGNYYLPDAAATLGVAPGFQVPGNAPFFEPAFDPLQLGLYVSPGTTIDLTQIHEAKYESTVRGDYNNVAPRLGLAWQPSFAPRVVIRGGWGVFYERTGASYKRDLQLAAPFFVLQNVPAPPDMADPYPRLNINPFQIPLNVRIGVDANGAPRWLRADGTTFPASEPFTAKSNVFIDPLLRTPYLQQWTSSLQYELRRGMVIDVGYVGSRGVGLLGKINRAVPIDPRVTPVNGFTDIYDRLGRAINPDFFVPAEFLGLNRNGGFQQLTNIGRSTYHSLQAKLRASLGQTLTTNIAYTLSRSMDTLSSDGGLVEHDPARPENNFGPSDYDRTHRLTTSFVLQVPGLGGSGSFGRALTSDWNVSGIFTYQTGTPFSVIGNPTRNAFFAQVARPRVGFAPGMDIDDAVGSGRVQDRLDNYFNVNAFADSLDQWGNTGRNILRGPSQMQLDLILARSLRLAATHRLELRWELYNALNTPVFANPASTFAANGTGTAGRITSTIGGPRTMQLAARYLF
ncbi:MAG TPA: TonB-dependent receptor [Vicinamibacterales bacterium]|nr:TonB-dependent receptor [Vicinamibacterales bacterium]